MKAIFLDIDGVLNCSSSKSRCGSLLGVDKAKVKILAEIVDSTGADLILSSSWKVGWEPKGRYSAYDEPHAKYLDAHLKKKGGLVCKDKTRERNLAERGMGIKSYLLLHPEYTEWIVIDDEIFGDYPSRGILPHLIKTDAAKGLTKKDADAAIKMLRGEIIGPYGSDSPTMELDVIL